MPWKASPSEPSSGGAKSHTFRFHLPRILNRSRTAPSLASEADNVSFSSTGPNEVDGPSRDMYQVERRERLISTTLAQRPALHDAVLTNTSAKLKRTLKSCDNLQTYAGADRHQPQLSGPAPLLLPSPIASNAAELTNLGPSFAFYNPRAFHGRYDRSRRDEWENDNIMAGYYRDSNESNMKGTETVATAPIQRGRSFDPSTPERLNGPRQGPLRSPPTSNMSAPLRSPRRDRSSSLSSEATWLSKSFTHQTYTTFTGQLETIKRNEKRLGEGSRRCCRVFGSVDDLHTGNWTGERKAVSRHSFLTLSSPPSDLAESYATVIKPGKANQLWLPRPEPSSLPSERGRRTSKGPQVPSTPEDRKLEVSAFSPWETPGNSSVGSDGRRESQDPIQDLAVFRSIRHSSAEPFFHTSPLSRLQRRDAETSWIESPYGIDSSSRSSSTVTSERTRRGTESPSPSSTPETAPVDQSAQSKRASLTTTLDALEQTIDLYPRHLCQLDSRWILQIRDANSLDELHMDRLVKIFPSSSKRHLSALAAMLIAQSFLTKLPATVQGVRTYRPCPASPLLSPSPSPSPSPSSGYPNTLPWETPNGATAGFAPIHPLDVRSDRPDERWVRKRAKTIEVALQATVQKLLIRICGKYDHLLWTALMCLVETVELGC